MGSCHCGSAVTNLTSIHGDACLIPGLTQWVKDLVLLWLWCRLVTIALIRPLAWELPYAAGVTLKTKTKTRNNNNRKERLWGPARGRASAERLNLETPSWYTLPCQSIRCVYMCARTCTRMHVKVCVV